MTDKKIKIKVVNSSGSEAFKAAGIEIPRSFNDVLELPFYKANELVAALSGIAAVETSFVTDSLQNDVQQSVVEVEVATLNLAIDAERQINVELTAKLAEQQLLTDGLKAQIATLEAVKPVEEETTKTAEVEAVKPAEVEAVKPAEVTAAKASTKKDVK
jgi:hypothetical protein